MFCWWETPAGLSIPLRAKAFTVRCSADRRPLAQSSPRRAARAGGGGFCRRVSATIAQTLRFSLRAAAAFYANPARGFRAMRLPFVRRSLVKTYTHGLNVKSLAMRIALSHADVAEIRCRGFRCNNAMSFRNSRKQRYRPRLALVEMPRESRPFRRTLLDGDIWNHRSATTAKSSCELNIRGERSYRAIR